MTFGRSKIQPLVSLEFEFSLTVNAISSLFQLYRSLDDYTLTPTMALLPIAPEILCSPNQ